MTTRKTRTTTVETPVVDNTPNVETPVVDTPIVSTPVVPESATPIVTDVQSMIDGKISKTTILSLLQYNDKLTRKQAVAYLERFEMTTGKRNDMVAIVKLVKEQEALGVSKRLAAQNIAATGLTTEATAFHYMSLLNFVHEYVKQSV
jgi:hypothetical protein